MNKEITREPKDFATEVEPYLESIDDGKGNTAIAALVTIIASAIALAVAVYIVV